MEEEVITWKEVDKTIQKKIEEIREKESGIDDPVLMSFLQVHEEILQDVRGDLRELKVSFSSKKTKQDIDGKDE